VIVRSEGKMDEKRETIVLTEEQRRKQRGRSLAIALVLVAIVLLLYAYTWVVGPGLLNSPL
jgi:hypothetical protein